MLCVYVLALLDLVIRSEEDTRPIVDMLWHNLKHAVHFAIYSGATGWEVSVGEAGKKYA